MAAVATHLPPLFHRAFTPVLLGVKAEGVESIGKYHKISINKPVTYEEYSSLLVELFDQTHYVNLQAYVKSLFKHGEQYVPYTICINYVPIVGTFVACRSAAQPGEGLSMEPLVCKLLTDMDTLVAYKGYPSQVSALMREGDFFDTNPGGIPSFIGIHEDGIHNIPVACGMSGVSANRKRTYSVTFEDFICQKTTTPPVSYEVEVRVYNYQEEYISASGGGTVAQGLEVDITASLLDTEFFVFEGWLVDGVLDESIPQSGKYKPTKEYTLLEAKVKQYRYYYATEGGDAWCTNANSSGYLNIDAPIPLACNIQQSQPSHIFEAWYVTTAWVTEHQNTAIPQNGSYNPFPAYQPANKYLTKIWLKAKSKENDNPYFIYLRPDYEHPSGSPAYYYIVATCSEYLPETVYISGTMNLGGNSSFSISIDGNYSRTLVYTTEADPEFKSINVSSIYPPKIGERRVEVIGL